MIKKRRFSLGEHFRAGVRRSAIRVLTAMLLAVPAASYAVGWVWIPDASLLKYALTPDGRVYFRNLNEFNGAALGCCYNYWVDTNSAHGKNLYALFLSKAAQNKGFYFSIPDGGAPGSIDYVGEW